MEFTTTAHVDGVPQDIEHEGLHDVCLNQIGVTDDHRGKVTGFAPPRDMHRVLSPDAEDTIALHVCGTGLSRGGSSARRYYEPVDSERQT